MTSDPELVALCNFLDELSLADIIQLHSDAKSLEAAEFFVTDVTSDEDADSDNEDPKSTKNTRKAKSEAERVRQRVYDKKCRSKKKTIHETYREAFMAALNELIELMHFRVVRTEKETNVLCLAKKNGRFVSLRDATHQLALNQGVINCILSCAAKWESYKNGDTGKFFLRGMAKDIRNHLDNLLELGEQLSVATAELRWRVEGRTTEVWV